jgi:phage terminase large subunit-like protein
VRGIVITTFTPLLGISEVVQSFLPKDYVPSEA